jgi:ABC-type cobalamin/Fe3+-siderophores transport system ATPase subunit
MPIITKVYINNFKRLQNISFSLSESVVIIGPNNAGKSTIFQALSLWEIGVTKFIQYSKKGDLNRSGSVVVNRKDLLNSPISDARFLWRNKNVIKHAKNLPQNDYKGTKHIEIEITLEGENENGKLWKCTAEFLFSNAESFGCKVTEGLKEISELYETGQGIHFGFLQPMSGLATEEPKLLEGAIEFRLGEGRTAEVLRNICYEVLNPETAPIKKSDPEKNWENLTIAIKKVFGATLHKPELIKTNGTIVLEYSEHEIKYDISSSGRGFQQTLLLLAYMYSHPGTILLLDEPDAHLEVLRQREVFQLINEVADNVNSQVIIASHSEVVLNEASDASKIIALISDNAIELNGTTQAIGYLKKALTEIGWEKYYLAKLKKHVLYLEGSTDLEMLIEFASRLRHRAESLLRRANMHPTENNVPNTAVANFVSLKEFIPELKGLALFDNLPGLANNPKLEIICWRRRELENYFSRPDLLLKHATLLGYAKYPTIGPVRLKSAMEKTIADLTPPIFLRDLNHDWWKTAKITDEWLKPIFTEFYKNLNIPQDFYKRDFYSLIKLMEPETIDSEIIEKLDRLYEFLKD